MQQKYSINSHYNLSSNDWFRYCVHFFKQHSRIKLRMELMIRKPWRIYKNQKPIWISPTWVVVVQRAPIAEEAVLVVAEGLRGVVRRRCREGSRYRRHSGFPLAFAWWCCWPSSVVAEGSVLVPPPPAKGLELTGPSGDSWRLRIFSSNVAVMALSKSLPVRCKNNYTKTDFCLLHHVSLSLNNSKSSYCFNIY